MIKKVMRGLFSTIGAAIGYGFCVWLKYLIEKSHNEPLEETFTMAQQISIAAVIAIIFFILFFRMGPALGRSAIRLSGKIQNDIKGVSAGTIAAGTLGLICGLVIAFLISHILSIFANMFIYASLSILTYLVFAYLGVVIGISKAPNAETTGGLLSAADKRNAGPVAWSFGKDKSEKKKGAPKILDTSVIIDGRILDIMRTGFLEPPIVIPEFVLVELRHIADSSDALRRVRGRRGLDVLNKIQTEYGVEIYNTDDEKSLKEIPEVDVKLLKLAQIMSGKVVTNDYNLNKVAAINNIPVLNINDLANALKPVVIPGESMRIAIVKHGSESEQGVGYLDDGTMVVVEDGEEKIGETVDINVTSALQTSAGRMIFGRLK